MIFYDAKMKGGECFGSEHDAAVYPVVFRHVITAATLVIIGEMLAILRVDSLPEGKNCKQCSQSINDSGR